MSSFRTLRDVPGRQAPNRTIYELFSANSGGAHGVTLRIVDLVPVAEQVARQPHAHPHFEETIYVLAGHGQFWCEGVFTPITAGDAILVNAGSMHATFNLADQPLRLACFFPVAAGVDDIVLADYVVTTQKE